MKDGLLTICTIDSGQSFILYIHDKLNETNTIKYHVPSTAEILNDNLFTYLSIAEIDITSFSSGYERHGKN